MNQADVETLRGVRRILVRHWLDLGQLAVRCVNGVIYIRGRLQRLPGFADGLTAAGVGGITTEIGGARGVRRTQFDIANWVFVNGAWQSLEEKTVRAPVSGSHTVPGQGEAAWTIDADNETP